MILARLAARGRALACLLALLLALPIGLAPQPVQASQGSLVLPTTGTVSGLSLIQGINLGFDALATCNAGPSAPSNLSGGTALGHCWINTSAAPYAVAFQDGTGWRVWGYLDAVNHRWILPPATTQFQLIDGTLAAPGLGFSSEPATGIRRAGAGDLRFVVNGVDVLQVTTGGVSILSGSLSSDPVGTVKDYLGTTAPAGYLLADGGCYSKTTYAALYAVMGDNYGSGCAAGQFRMLDARGRVLAGANNMGGTDANRLTSFGLGTSANVLGAAGGSESRTMTIANLPAHSFSGSFSISAGSAFFFYRSITGLTQTGVAGAVDDVRGGGSSPGGDYSRVNITVDANSGTFTTNTIGSGSPIASVQPTVIVNKIVKY